MGSKPTVLVSHEISKNTEALDALEEKIGPFEAVIMQSFEEIMNPLYEYVHDIDWFVKLAKDRLGVATNVGGRFYDIAERIDIIAVSHDETYNDGSEGTGAGWYLDKFLMKFVRSSNPKVQFFEWQDKEQYWA